MYQIRKKHFLSNATNFQPRGTYCVHPTIFVHYPWYLMIYNRKATENWGHIDQSSPRGTSGEIRTFSENCTSTSRIGGNKLKTQKTIFLIFPKIGSGTCRGSSRTLHRFWCIYPVSSTFFLFLSIVPGGHFGQF